MAAIVQSNPYNCLIRKIGYSVGLESVLNRIVILAERYATNKKINYSEWEQIVREEYKLSGEKSVEHVGNFFSSLNILKIYNREVTGLYGLDILSILRRYFTSDEEFKKAAKYFITLAVIEADGDIFLNCLSSSFDKTRIRNSLVEMLQAKRGAVKKAITNQEILKTVISILDIKQQKQSTNDKSSIFSGRNTSPFEVRKEPLYGTANDEISISDDYIKKVPQTRKGWAHDLGLFDNNQITHEGHRILAELSCLGLCTQNGTFVFWPYKQEFLTIFIDPKEIDVPSIGQIDILSCLSSTQTETEKETFDPNVQYTNEIEDIRTIYNLYKSGDIERGKIRHQLPLYVLYPALFAINYVKTKSIIPISEILEREFRSRERLINKVNIAGTEGAIIIK